MNLVEIYKEFSKMNFTTVMAFAVLKILRNLVFMPIFLFANNCWIKAKLKKVCNAT